MRKGPWNKEENGFFRDRLVSHGHVCRLLLSEVAEKTGRSEWAAWCHLFLPTSLQFPDEIVFPVRLDSLESMLSCDGDPFLTRERGYPLLSVLPSHGQADGFDWISWGKSLDQRIPNFQQRHDNALAMKEQNERSRLDLIEKLEKQHGRPRLRLVKS